MPNNSDVTTEGGNLPKRIAFHAERPYGLTLRSAIAAIPLVGGSISVLVESQLSARQSGRIDLLFARLSELETRFANLKDSEDRAAHPSESLLEHAVTAAASTPDQERARVFADIVFLEGAGRDRSEVLRRFLIEVMATLTRYEMALLLRYGPVDAATSGTPFAEQLLELHTHNPEVDDVRQFSMQRLATFRLIDRPDGDVQLTPVGKKLLSVI